LVSQQSIRILIVEDNVFTAKLLTIQLSEYGYISHTASSAETALELLKKNTYTLILCDLYLPKMNGLSFLNLIREDILYADIPFLIMSSDDEENTIVRLLQAGADDYITKPIQTKVFVSKIQNLLAKQTAKKRSISQKLERQLTENETTFLVCSEHDTDLFFTKLAQNTSYIFEYVNTAHDFLYILETKNAVCVCVTEDVSWLIKELEKSNEITIGKFLLIYITPYESLTNSVYDSYCNVLYLNRNASREEIMRNMTFVSTIIESEKAKSMVFIKESIQQSGFLFDSEFEYSTGQFSISLFHKNYNDMPGGDFYEVVDFNERYTFVFVGDIMGKSWSAWFYLPVYLAYIRSTIKFLSARNITELAAAPHKILNMLNSYFAKDLQLSDVFTTLTLAVIDNQDNKIILSNAGGIHPLLYSKKKNSIQNIRVSGMLMGIDSSTSYSKIEIECVPGDVLCLYTDGYIEVTQQASSKMIGNEGMQNILDVFVRQSKQTAHEFDSLFHHYFEIQSVDDDRTCAIILCNKT
jgi:CheY-like chemotaxis protein